MGRGQHQPVADRAEAGSRLEDQPGDGSARLAGSHPARNQRGLRALWSWTFGASMWRSVAYGLLLLPAGIASLLLALAGADQPAARLQRGLADRWLHLSLAPPPISMLRVTNKPFDPSSASLPICHFPRRPGGGPPESAGLWLSPGRDHRLAEGEGSVKGLTRRLQPAGYALPVDEEFGAGEGRAERPVLGSSAPGWFARSGW